MEIGVRIDPAARDFIFKVWILPGSSKALTIFPELPWLDDQDIGHLTSSKKLEMLQETTEGLHSQKKAAKILWSIGTVLLSEVPTRFVVVCDGVPFFAPPELRSVITTQRILLRSGMLVIEPPI